MDNENSFVNPSTDSGMKGWLEPGREQRINTLNILSEQTGLPKAAIEKDWWVTLTLRSRVHFGLFRLIGFQGRHIPEQSLAAY